MQVNIIATRCQFNRLVRFYTETIEKMALHLARIMGDSQPPYQALDASAMPVRDAERRGHGWLAGQADIGWSNSLGWYEGFSLLTAVEPSGVITGFVSGPLPPPTSHWRKPSSLQGHIRIPGS